MASLTTILGDLVDLAYPRICAACDDNTAVRHDIFCVPCMYRLPFTGYHLHADNPMERHFWGRVNISAGAAYLYFVPGGTTQNLLHNIKYRGYRNFAVDVGRRFGNQLLESPRFRGVDGIVPVPLHRKKYQKRGFNQSASFGEGLSQVMNIPVIRKNLVRIRHTASQTRMSRFDRIHNMKAAFRLNRPEEFPGKHLLLVDDVLTTGATLESCALCMFRAGNVRISFATIACGRI